MSVERLGFDGGDGGGSPVVTPAHAGVQGGRLYAWILDSRVRGNDGMGAGITACVRFDIGSGMA
ncbi:MAG: hypothetical protein DHS20C16_23890 [Phycisphaerae bacterium]|nr:MAG: hypothetical protein DHS20C16_23890 [Phycisphaerae bacterium]